MDPETNPEANPSTTPAELTPAGGTGAPQAPAGFVEQARFNGLMRTVQELTVEKRNLDAELATTKARISQLEGQLLAKDTEKTVVVGERDKQLQELVTAKTAAENELQELRALKLKVEAITELKRPDLLPLLDKVGNLTDKEAVKTVLNDFANFADNVAKQREQQLTAGQSPSISPILSTPSQPNTEKGWVDLVNSLPVGSPERTKAMNDWWTWGKSQKPGA